MDLNIFVTGAAAVEVAAVELAVLVAVGLGCTDGVPDAAFVAFSCSNGIMTASSTCTRPLCVLSDPVSSAKASHDRCPTYKTFALMTFALLNQIVLLPSFSSTFTFTVPFCRLLNSCPSTRKSLYATSGSV